jgi:hypothetical protein
MVAPGHGEAHSVPWRDPAGAPRAYGMCRQPSAVPARLPTR